MISLPFTSDRIWQFTITEISGALGSDVVAAPSVTSDKKKLDAFKSKNTGR